MTAYRTTLALAASTLAFANAQAAQAQDVPAQSATVPAAEPASETATDPAALAGAQDDIIVTGTRAVGRSRLDKRIAGRRVEFDRDPAAGDDRTGCGAVGDRAVD